MTRACDFCGREYEAKLSTSKFCMTQCRVASHKGQSPPAVVRLPAPEPAVDSELVRAVRAELEAAEKVDSALGQLALGLAQRVASGSDPASGVAALTREMRTALAEATRGVSSVSRLASYQDELAARRKRA